MSNTVRLLAVGVALFALSTVPAAQQLAKPDFSGKWTLVHTGIDTADHQVPGPLGQFGEITQDDSSISFTGGNLPLRSRLDGTPLQVGTRTSQLRWISSAALVTTTRSEAFGKWDDAILVSLNGPDTLTIVETTALLTPRDSMRTTLLTYKRRH